MLEQRRFHIGEVLSVVLFRDVAPRGTRGFCSLFDYLAGRSLTPAQRAAYMTFGREAIKTQYPELFYFAPDDLPSKELLGEWLRRRQMEFGEFLVVHPAHAGMPLPQDPEAIKEGRAFHEWAEDRLECANIVDDLSLTDDLTLCSACMGIVAQRDPTSAQNDAVAPANEG